MSLRGGAEAAVYIEGPTWSPVTVLLMHGCGSDARTWTPLVSQLAKLLTGAVRVVGFDQRGHGRSSLGTLPVTVELLAEDAGQVLDAVCPAGRVVLAAHSMGGMAALCLARVRPDLFGPQRISALLLVGTTAGGSPTLEDATQTGRAGKDGAGFPAWMGWLVAVASLARRIPLRTVSCYHRALMRHRVDGPLAGLERCRVTVLVGERDRWTPPGHSQHLADMIPGARMRIVPAAGHYLPRTHPALLAGLIRAEVEAVSEQHQAAVRIKTLIGQLFPRYTAGHGGSPFHAGSPTSRHARNRGLRSNSPQGPGLRMSSGDEAEARRLFQPRPDVPR